jgi:hypothetical protein
VKVIILVAFLYGYFFDITEDVGLFGPPYGRECIAFDADGDGDVDLFVASSKAGNSSFYENLGDGTFMEITGRTGIDVEAGIYKALNIDIDQDGLMDLVIFEAVPYSPPSFYENMGNGFFQKRKTPLNFTLNSISFIDIDGDSKVDLVGSRPDKEQSEVIFFLQKDPWIFERKGSLWFKGIVQDILLCDFNDDGFFDLYLVVDGGTHHLLENRGEGRFIDVSNETGVFRFRGGTSAELLDYDEDGILDLLILGTERGNIVLHMEDGVLEVMDETEFKNYGDLKKAFPNDFDLDGDLDILFLDEMGFPLLLSNDGGMFRRVDEPDLHMENCFSATFADFDGDRDPDLLLVTDKGPRLLENRIQGERVYSITLRCAENRALYFGKIEAFFGNSVRAFPLSNNFLLLPQGDLYPCDSIRVRWSSGLLETFKGPFEDSINLIEGTGEKVVETGFSFPPRDTILRIFPNPTKGAFTILYTVKEPSEVEIRVLSSSGQTLKILESGFKSEGTYIIVWEGERPGTYLIHLKIGDKVYFKKIVLLE